MQVVLAVSSESLSKLAEMADKIIAFSPGAVYSVSDSAFASCHVSQRDEQLLKMQKQIDELPRLVRSGSRHTSPRPHLKRSLSRTGAQKREDWQCWYHLGLKRKQNSEYRLVHLNGKKRDSLAGVATTSVLRSGSRKLYVNDIKTHTGLLIDTGK
ncbi:hypothetical protein AVEN_46501-1 [Araneus ventricosus]|uniref:Uncharacterized protein n=1 Tax=Araneus ventricosus TaxID=182803 RepID=A0A4Y2EPC0_ARAVE|nr:hypothetical protein AVEN_46501-1 [Araneus ventricosus]